LPYCQLDYKAIAIATAKPAVAFVSIWSCALELKVLIYWNSVFVTVPSAIFVASIKADKVVTPKLSEVKAPLIALFFQTLAELSYIK